jgi:hypothetical protein
MKRQGRIAGALACMLGLALAGLDARLTARQSPAPALDHDPAPPHGAMSGVVVDGTTGAPVEGAIVSILGGVKSTTQPNRQLTDAKGRFAFTELADSDSFQIISFKFGFLDGGYGRDSGPADALRMIVIKGGAWVPNLRVPIWRAGGLSGTVRDENGEPVVGVFVRALARVRIGGRDEMASGPAVLTDDRGIYRLPGLFPGRYVVQVPSPQMSVPASVEPAPGNGGSIDVDESARLFIGSFPLPPPRMDGRTMVYAQTFHPSGSVIAQATVLDVAPGDERAGIDITLTPVPAVRVSGTVEGPPDALVNLTVRLLPPGLENSGWGADGSFRFVNVAAGSYTIDAPSRFNAFAMQAGSSRYGGFVGQGATSLPPPPPRSAWSSTSSSIESAPGASLSQTNYRGGDAPNYFGRTPVTVGAADVAGVVVRLQPPTTMRGRVTFESDPGKPAPPRPPSVSLQMDPAGGSPTLASSPAQVTQASPDFEIPGLLPGEYWLRTNFTNGWIVKSVQWRGRDFSAAPITIAGGDDVSGVLITVTDMTPVLTGTVRLPAAAANDGNVVVAFPASADLRVNTGLAPSRMKSTAASSDGAYRFTSLPAGDYFVAAVDRAHVSSWRDPQFLSALERTASRTHLEWGRTTNLDLTLVMVR